jgi:CBS domain containing-hemolysin-like protein
MNEWGYPMFILLLALDLAIAATRVSLFNARPTRLANYQGSRPAKVSQTLALIENLSTRANLRLSQTMVRFLLAVLIYQQILLWYGSNLRTLMIIGIVSLLVLTMLMLLIEFSVENWVMRDPDKWALVFVNFGRVIKFFFSPLTFLPLLVLKPVGVHQNYAQFTEDELKTWVESDEEPGSLEREERQMIYSIFHFGDTLTREIMVPRIDILSLDVDTTQAEAIQAFLSSGHSRLPVYDGTIDNLIGLLYAKDLLAGSLKQDTMTGSLRELLRPAYFVPETKKVDELLAEMQSQRIHMGIVVDEYGGVAGLVTLEDIVEEIVGEIRDEYDSASEEILFSQGEEGEYIFQGRIGLDDFNELMNSKLPKDEADTLAGYLYDQMGRVPLGGESFVAGGLSFTIDLVSGRRIRRVRVSRVLPMEERSGNDKHDG